MIDISIIVPIYNAERYLRKCLDSLVNQTKKELEFILVNDGSTDTTEDIIKTYKDKRIKYFKNKNQGIGKTRNFGIEKSTGKYIMFVDSDDYLEKNACEILYNKAINTNSDLVVCDFYKVYENEELEEVRLIDFKQTSLKKMPSLINKINLSPWNKIYKRELITSNNLKFIENLKYEDAPFVLQSVFYAKNISKVNECLNYYVIHGNSETTVRDKKCFDILKIIDIIRNDLKEEYLKEELDNLTVRIVTNYTIQQRMQKDKEIGMEFIDKAFAYLKKEVPDYKSNKYYPGRGIKRIIEKNKTLTNSDEEIFAGSPASTGEVIGKSAYYRNLKDIEKWNDGDILISMFTDPDWLDIMSRSSGLVTAVGGMLCHSAIIARELGIPCVTGVGRKALKALRDENEIYVNGTTGEVCSSRIYEKTKKKEKEVIKDDKSYKEDFEK